MRILIQQQQQLIWNSYFCNTVHLLPRGALCFPGRPGWRTIRLITMLIFGNKNPHGKLRMGIFLFILKNSMSFFSLHLKFA